jgi:hypothetical protein
MAQFVKGDPMTLAVGATLTTDVPFAGAKFVGIDIDSTVTGTLLTLQVMHNSYPDTPVFADVSGPGASSPVTFVPISATKSVALLAPTSYVPKAGDRLRIKSGTTQATAAATITPIFEV